MFCAHRELRVDPDLGRESDCESGNRIPTIYEVWEEINDSSDPWLGRTDFWYAQAYFISIQLGGMIINILQRYSKMNWAVLAQLGSVLYHINRLNLHLHTAVCCVVEFNRIYLVHLLLTTIMCLIYGVSLISQVHENPIKLVDVILQICCFISWINWNVGEKLMYVRNIDNVIRFRGVKDTAILRKVRRPWFALLALTIALLGLAFYLETWNSCIDVLSIDGHSPMNLIFRTLHRSITHYMQLVMYLSLERRKRKPFYIITNPNWYEMRFLGIIFFDGIICGIYCAFVDKWIRQAVVWLRVISLTFFNVHLWFYSAHELNVYQSQDSTNAEMP